MNKADRQRLDRVASLGCIACRVQGTPGTPAQIHHLREGVGAGQRSPHERAIPLCSHHHVGTNHPETPSIHLARRQFIETFGTESELLERVNRLIGG